MGYYGGSFHQHNHQVEHLESYIFNTIYVFITVASMQWHQPPFYRLPNNTNNINPPIPTHVHRTVRGNLFKFLQHQFFVRWKLYLYLPYHRTYYCARCWCWVPPTIPHLTPPTPLQNSTSRLYTQNQVNLWMHALYSLKKDHKNKFEILIVMSSPALIITQHNVTSVWVLLLPKHTLDTHLY